MGFFDVATDGADVLGDNIKLFVTFGNQAGFEHVFVDEFVDTFPILLAD